MEENSFAALGLLDTAAAVVVSWIISELTLGQNNSS